MSKQTEDEAIRRMFKGEIQAAYWLRTETLKDIVGLEIAFEDGSRIQIASENPIGVRIIEPVRSNNKKSRR